MNKKRTFKALQKFKFIDSMNSLVGSWLFLVVHVVWFIIWLGYDLDINMLTMVVSLEAIILMILLLMSQNRQALRDDIRDEMDLQADLRSAKLAEEILVHIETMRRDVRQLKKK
ncbi:DUF1003 domain-containing protein [bacterium]|jgi:uncharacterized membrane protein|nr:DUF1003 domain-containing protein [bacterium]MBT4649393.1 DUF1003 domain-containing protein [bacterium]